MSTYVLALLTLIWQWVVSPPLNWLLSLTLEWQIELGALAILIFYGGSILERCVVSRVLGSEWWRQQRRAHEWYRYAAMESQDFAALIRSMRQQADQQNRLAERLGEHRGAGYRGEILRRAARRREMRGQEIHDEADRLERLWQAIEKERANPNNGADLRTKVLRLMRRLGSLDDRAASEALSELRRFGNSFDWDTLIPAKVVQPHRERVLKLLRLMAGTSSVEESCGAYRSALRVLEQFGCDEQWRAA